MCRCDSHLVLALWDGPSAKDDDGRHDCSHDGDGEVCHAFYLRASSLVLDEGGVNVLETDRGLACWVLVKGGGKLQPSFSGKGRLSPANTPFSPTSRLDARTCRAVDPRKRMTSKAGQCPVRCAHARRTRFALTHPFLPCISAMQSGRTFLHLPSASDAKSKKQRSSAWAARYARG